MLLLAMEAEHLPGTLLSIRETPTDFLYVELKSFFLMELWKCLVQEFAERANKSQRIKEFYKLFAAQQDFLIKKKKLSRNFFYSQFCYCGLSADWLVMLWSVLFKSVSTLSRLVCAVCMS